MAWSGRSQPATLGLAPRRELQGRVGQGAAPHFGLEGGPEKQKGNGGSRAEGVLRQPARPAAFPGSSGLAGQAPQTGTRKLASSTPQAGLAPHSHREGWLGHSTKCPERHLGWNPHPTLGTAHTGAAKRKDSVVESEATGGPSSLPFPGCCSPNMRYLGTDTLPVQPAVSIRSPPDGG